jgi:hypothetical protein
MRAFVGPIDPLLPPSPCNKSLLDDYAQSSLINGGYPYTGLYGYPYTGLYGYPYTGLYGYPYGSYAGGYPYGYPYPGLYGGLYANPYFYPY